MSGRRLTWLSGGIGLIVCGIVGVVRDSVLGSPGLQTILTLMADVLWAGGILILAIGLSREGSVVARSALGLVASVAVAIWPAIRTLVALFADRGTIEQVSAWAVWDYFALVLPLMVGIIAAERVARTRAVPSPWNWAPLWVVGIQSFLWVSPQVINVASPDLLIEMGGLLAAFGTLSFLASTLGLGILAVILAGRSRTGTVPVFQSSTPE